MRLYQSVVFAFSRHDQVSYIDETNINSTTYLNIKPRNRSQNVLQMNIYPLYTLAGCPLTPSPVTLNKEPVRGKSSLQQVTKSSSKLLPPKQHDVILCAGIVIVLICFPVNIKTKNLKKKTLINIITGRTDGNEVAIFIFKYWDWNVIILVISKTSYGKCHNTSHLYLRETNMRNFDPVVI